LEEAPWHAQNFTRSQLGEAEKGREDFTENQEEKNALPKAIKGKGGCIG